MNKKIIYLVILVLPMLQISYAQEKPLEVSMGTIKTVLNKNAIDFGVRFAQPFGSLFKQQDILLAGKNSLFQATPEFNIQSGTEDAFSSVDLKLSGLFMFFKNTEIGGQVTPCTNCYMHILPLSAGIETNNTFSVINGIVEFGYVPWYQSPMMNNVPDWIKYTKIGFFLQGGYKFSLDTANVNLAGGKIDESKEAAEDGIFRAKGSLAINTKSLFEINGVGVGFIHDSDVWYDILNRVTYYRIDETVRLYLTQDKDKYFDLKYQIGSGAPNFNQGDQFGMKLTITF
jgi:hypothetical protein